MLFQRAFKKPFFKNTLLSNYSKPYFFSTSQFKQLTSDDINYFSSFLAPNEIIQDSFELQAYNSDWLKKYIGNSKLALKPNSTEKISKILKYCSEQNIAVVPQGGNTGLVGGSTPVNDEVILSLKNLNKIIGFDEISGVLTCEAGCVLETLNQYLAEKSYEMPLDLGAKGSCAIGGNIATNAGGTHFVKFGPFKSYILGLEVVLPNGEILELESKILKDNTGLDLKQVFIGSEGILGVITKANIRVFPVDKYKQVLFMQCENFENVLEINKLVRGKLGRNLGAIEYQDAYAYATIQKYIQNAANPFPNNDMGKYYVLIEVCGTEALDDIVENLYTELSERKLVEDCIASESDAQFTSLWKIREEVAVAANHIGLVFKYDISLPVEKFEELCLIVRNKIGCLGYTMGYGHLGDGNMHINVGCYDLAKKKQVESILEPFVFEWLSHVNGSISAEHGVGRQKAKYLHFSKDVQAIEYMKSLKKVFDPKGIMNPYKVLPYSS